MRLQEAENSVNAPPPPPFPFTSASHLRSKSGTSDVYDVPQQDGWWCIFRESVIRHLFFIFPYISFFPGRWDGDGGGMGEAQRGRTATKHTAIRKYTEYVFFVWNLICPVPNKTLKTKFIKPTEEQKQERKKVNCSLGSLLRNDCSLLGKLTSLPFLSAA